MSKEPGLTALGKILSFFVIAALLVLGAFVVMNKSKPTAPAGHSAHDEASAGTSTADEPAAGVVEPQTQAPRLPAAGAYVPKDNVVEIEISEYAGYAGLVVANGGLAPSENSLFSKKCGFKVKLTVSEEESWSKLNSGKHRRLGHHRRTCSPSTGGSSRSWCRRRSASRAAPTAWW